MSISAQLEECTRYANHHGIEIVGHYSDPGASAWSDKGRVNFDRMIEAGLTLNPNFDAIVVLDRSRFFRRQAESKILRGRLRKNGVQVRSVQSDIHDDGRTGTLAIDFEEVMNEYYSVVTSEKVRIGMEATARAGFYAGGIVPHGYKLEVAEYRGSRAKHRLVVAPEEAALIKEVHERHRIGRGVTTITHDLNEQGFRTRSGKLWSKGQIHRILTDETYVGRDFFKPSDPQTGKRLPRAEWIEIPCPAIIDEETFQDAQRRLASRAPRVRAPRYTTSPVLLGGIAVCGSCGGALQLVTGTSQNGTVHRYYKCAAKTNRGTCSGGQPISVPEATLDNAVVSALTSQLLTASRIKALVAKVFEKRRQEQGSASDSLKRVRSELAAAKRQEQNLWSIAAEMGLSAQSGFREKLEAVQTTKDGLERHAVSLERFPFSPGHSRRS